MRAIRSENAMSNEAGEERADLSDFGKGEELLLVDLLAGGVHPGLEASNELEEDEIKTRSRGRRHSNLLGTRAKNALPIDEELVRDELVDLVAGREEHGEQGNVS